MSEISEIREALEETLNNFRDLFSRVEQLEAAPLITSGSGGGAPVDAQYLVNAANAILTNEIVVTAAQGRIIYGDAVPTWTTLNIGAANTILQSNGSIPGWQTLSAAGIAPSNASYITVSLEAGLTSERNLNINNGLTFTDNGANNSYDVNLGTPSNVTSSSINNVTASSHTHALDVTGVIAGTYGDATNVGQFTVDSKGRLTNATNVAITGVPPAAHAILSSFHSDAATDTVSRGSLIVGNSTPQWDELTIGANETILQSDGTDATWIATTSDGAANHNTVLRSNASGQITLDDLFVLDGGVVGIAGGLGDLVFNSGTNIRVFAVDLLLSSGLGITHQDGNTAGYVLRGNGTRYVPAQLDYTDLANVSGLAGDGLIWDGGSNEIDLGTPSTNSQSSINNVTATSHTHAITTTNDAITTPQTILASTAIGNLTLNNLVLNDASSIATVSGAVLIFLNNAVPSITLTGDVYFQNDLYQSAFRYHTGDTDTYDQFQTNQWTLVAGGTTMIDVVGGAVSINKTPAATNSILDVQGTITTSQNSITSYFATFEGGFYSSTSGGGSFPFTQVENLIIQGWTDGVNDRDIVFAVGASPATAMVIEGGTGYIGIGIDNPTVLLHVVSSSGFCTETIEATAANQTAQLQLINDVQNWQIRTDGSLSDYFVIRDATVNARRFVINTSGYVGIGLTSVNAKLDIDQSSTIAAIPVLQLDQGDISEQCINVRSDGVDRDINILTVDVTGTPTFSWDESDDSFYFNNDIRLPNGARIGNLASEAILTFQSVATDIAFFSNCIVGVDVSTNIGKFNVNQSNATFALPVVALVQGDLDEPFISYRGETAATNLTYSLVDESDVTTATRIGWVKIAITDDNGIITNGDYYMPFYTLA